MFISFVAPSNLYWDTRHFTLYNGTFPVCPQQRTGTCKCHVIVVVFRLRVQKLTPAELRLFTTQCGITIISDKRSNRRAASGYRVRGRGGSPYSPIDRAPPPPLKYLLSLKI